MSFILLIIIFIVTISIIKHAIKKDDLQRWIEHQNYATSEQGKKEIAERKLNEKTEWCKGKSGCIERTMVTGDYFATDYGRGAWNGNGTDYPCKYQDTSNCMYCLRRREEELNNKFYYGYSENCEHYVID